MRICVLGQHLHSAIAVLSMVEAAMFFAAVYAAVLARSHVDVGSLPDLRSLGGRSARALRSSASSW